MSKKQKLELTWIGKDKRPRLEPRILLEDKSLSYRATEKDLRGSEEDLPSEDLRGFENLVGLSHLDNLLIHGDNLLALKALEQQYAGKVKCVFIDPPYNTGSAFTHYDDGVEHSLWLSLMRDRLEAIRTLLAEDGSLWITIDDNEAHYLKVLCDEIFGRQNFISNTIWQKKYAPSNDAKSLSEDHDHILIYAKNKSLWIPNRLKRDLSSNNSYKNPDNDPRGLWRADNYKCNKNSTERPNLYYSIIQPTTGEEIWPLKTAVWRYNVETHKRHIAENLIWWGKDGKNGTPAFKRFLSTVDEASMPQSVWLWQDVGHNQDAKREVQKLNPDSPFSTPKPEKLIERILTIASNPNDLVLDSFAGSGTTGAVAHKMGRRWIMVELGNHCETHIVPRLKKVITGEDQGGISKAVNWQGGGGFRYFRLAPSLLKKDTWGNWIINKAYNAEMLSEAMCKHMGFQYAPSQAHFWMHGHSTETDFIYVTTGSLSHDQLKVISDEVGSNRTLLICCKAFMAETSAFANLTLKKIPQVILHKCEWDHDDYSFSLNVLADDDDSETYEVLKTSQVLDNEEE
ncbi:site-specific DNA-methyltransferase [Methylobacter sp.]|uniref:site-specific DNA-methyltransferase n=1 Tax=Methylobacter sp. TaxID=2051955 RepID=UPI002FDE7BF5